MYATYVYKPFPGLGQVIVNDVIALMTGVTDKNNLSAYCDLTQTEITSIEPAGWEVWDASQNVLRAVISDDATKYKYVKFTVDSAAYLKIVGWETWNNVAHTGTNQISDGGLGYYQQLNATVGGRLDIRATARCLAVFSRVPGYFGSLTGNKSVVFTERTRANGWDTVAAGYPKWLRTSFAADANGLSTNSPRTISAAGADVTGVQASYTSLVTPLGVVQTSASGMPNAIYHLVSDGNKNRAYLLLPVSISDNIRGDLGGEISSFCGIYFGFYGVGNVYDKIVEGPDEYMLWNNPYSFLSQMCVKKA